MPVTDAVDVPGLGTLHMRRPTFAARGRGGGGGRLWRGQPSGTAGGGRIASRTGS
jgi:hypothetical protein